MINWEQYSYNDKLDLKLVENDGTTIDLKVVFEDTEWTPHRHPYLADIKILESSDETMYPLNGIMRLPLITEDNLKFLLFHCGVTRHCDCVAVDGCARLV